MSADNIDSDEAVFCCASCGKAEIDEVKLKDCDGGCDIARYCSDECQQDHRPTHEAICTERAAELRDEILFRQPESSHLGDCLICFLPMPLDLSKSVVIPCCCKEICKGCSHAHGLREIEHGLGLRCPFCRKLAGTNEENDMSAMKRAEANDPLALLRIAGMLRKEGDYKNEVKYLKRAAELGSADAHCYLSYLYRDGEGVEKDEERAVYHMEEAAIGGHPDTRCNLGAYDFHNERYDRAVKHWIIAANLGQNESLQRLKECYKRGFVSKDDFAAALRAHQAAVGAMKSPQREAAEERMRLWQAAD